MNASEFLIRALNETGFLAVTLALELTTPIVAAGLGALVMFSLWLTWRWLRLRKIAELVRATRRIAAGDYETQVPADGLGGFSELADAFNLMAQRLRENNAALRASEERFRRVVESDLIGIVFWRADGTIWDGNDVLLRMLGRRREELGGGRFHVPDLIPAEHQVMFAENLQTLGECGSCAPFEIECLRADGTLVPVLLGAARLDNSSGDGVCFVVDITSRREAAAALRESEEKFRSIVETTSEWIWSVDVQGNYTYSNPASETMLGYKPDELLGRERLRFMREDDQPQMRKFWQTFVAERTGWMGLVIRWRHKDGSERFLESNAVALRDGAGRLLGYRGADRDITEQQKRERLLDENEQRYKSLFEYNIDAVFSFDLGGEFFSANPACQTVTGYSVEELLKMSIFDIVVLEDIERAQRHFSKAAEGDPQNCEIAITHREGRRVELNLSQFPIRVDAQIVGVYGVAKDITERKRLQEERDRLFDLSLDMFYIADFDGSFKQVNPAWKKSLGFTRDELLSRPILEFVHPEDAERVRGEWQKLVAGVPTRHFENRYLCQNGEFKWLAWTAMPLPEQRLIYAVARDITDTRRAQESIRQSEERYRSLVEGARDAIFTLAPEGSITSVNPAFESITGWKREEWIGRPLTAILHPMDVPFAIEAVQKASSGEKVPSLELRFSSSGGKFVPIETTVTAQWLGGRIVGLLGIGRDVSERKRLEDQLRQMQKLDSIGQLAAGIAHDFNNILTVQHGYLAMLRSDPRETGDRAEALRQVAEASDRAANLTRQLLLFSRKQVMQPKTVNLNDAITPLTKMLSRILGEHISLQLNYAPSLPAIHADTGMLEQVIVNLAVNARDAMPRGGCLMISTSVERLDAESVRHHAEARPGDFVVLKVADTGCGISPEHIPHIFEPFFTTKDVGKGTGLGLATVYGIVAQHRGWITVNSSVGRGTTFSIFLPGVAQSAPVADGPVQQLVRGGRETILVVEDEGALREMVQRILQRYGYEVVLAVSGAQALRIWETHSDQVNLLLTDMVMPEGVSGRVLAEELQARKPGLPVIFISGYSADVAGRDFMLREGYNFLQKPFHPDGLAQIVRAALDRRRGGL